MIAQNSLERRSFFRDIIEINPARVVVVIIFLHVLDFLTAFINFVINNQRFVEYEANPLLRAALIDGNIVSQVELEALLIVLLAMIYIFSRRKSSNLAGRSIALVLMGGFSVAIATNIIGGFLLHPLDQNYNMLCLVLGWAIWLASMQFAMKIEITYSLLAASVIPLIGGGGFILFGFYGKLAFAFSAILLFIVLALGARVKGIEESVS